MVEDIRKLLAATPAVRGDRPEPRLAALMLVATAGTAALILLTLPASTPENGVLTTGAVVVAGAAAAVAGYFGVPRLAWLPFLPASATMAAVVAGTGGSASPFWPLLLMLLVGGATLPHPKDVLVVALLVVAAGLSPFAYEAWSEYATTAKALQAASWLLAALIVTKVSASLRAAHQRGEERTQLVSAVLGSLPQQAAVVDSSGTILLTNDAWDRVHVLSGATPGAFTSGADYETACRHRDGAVVVTPTDLIDDLQHVLDGNATTAVSELSWELLVGEHHRFTVRTTALPDGLGAVVTHEDVTRLVEAEQTRQRSIEQLRDLDRRKTALLQAVSHDVRGPLTTISGVADVLHRKLNELDPADLQQLADGLAHQSQRLARLLSGLLLLSLGKESSPAADAVVQPEPTNIRDAIHVVLDRVDGGGRHITVKGPNPELVVCVDPWILDFILERLVDNAVRHTPDHTAIQVDVQVTDSRTLTVCVEDDGPGIPAEDHERVFLPFEQGSHSHPHDPGAGIGLAVVRHAAQLHGGDAWIDTTDRRGALLQAQLTVEPP